jgi:hypothetical protein
MNTPDVQAAAARCVDDRRVEMSCFGKAAEGTA